MTWHDDTLAFARAIGGDAVTGDLGFGPYTISVPSSWWRAVLTALRDRRGCTFFDWLTAVDESGAADGDDGFRLVCHVASLPAADSSVRTVQHLVVRTMISRAEPVIDSLTPVYAGAAWHERETHEMFGIEFAGGGPMETLLLPDAFEGHPLRKEFVLASRVAKAWPGAKEPGESDHDTAAPSRRRMRPPGVPDPEEWGPREPGAARSSAGGGDG